MWGLLTILLIVPFGAVRAHPLPDLSMHIAAASIWHHYSDPAFEFSRYYSLSMPAAPYWGYYTLTHLLAVPLGIDVANRVVLSLYALGLVGGAAALARCFGRDPRLGLLTAPFVSVSYTHLDVYKRQDVVDEDSTLLSSKCDRSSIITTPCSSGVLFSQIRFPIIARPDLRE